MFGSGAMTGMPHTTIPVRRQTTLKDLKKALAVCCVAVVGAVMMVTAECRRGAFAIQILETTATDFDWPFLNKIILMNKY